MLVEFTNRGLFCRQAGIYIDPWKPVDKAVITHAHSDHARVGMKQYLAHHDSANILRHRLGPIQLQTLEYHESISLNGVRISLHPAGHIIGSAQVRLEHEGEVWCISGDYKVRKDNLTAPYEPVKCQHFVTESTFGLPVYRFPEEKDLDQQLNQWVNDNILQGYNSVLIGYALGKAQRILNTLKVECPIILHSTIYNTNEAVGFDNSRYTKFTQEFKKEDIFPGVVVATGSALGSPWLNRFEPYRIAMCSGWMQLRGARRRSNLDMGFVMSDHADWEGLNSAVLATGAENIYVTHGYQGTFAKWLKEKHGLNATEIETHFQGENIENEPTTEPGKEDTA
jgi:putative mRNA 3-end processing factor